MTERTLVLIKPDAMARRLAGEILARYERKSLAVLAMDLRTVDDETAGALYAEHIDKAFYPGLREFITSAPLIALVLEGDQAIEVVRLMNGGQDDAERGRSGHDPWRLWAVEVRKLGARLGFR